MDHFSLRLRYVDGTYRNLILVVIVFDLRSHYFIKLQGIIYQQFAKNFEKKCLSSMGVVKSNS
jgi:hypothetical protein